MSNLSSLLDRYKALVIFDTETSGLNPGDDQIIELAALRVERTTAGALRIAGKMDTFIKLPEGEQLPENIVTLTGITDRLLETEGVQSGTAVSRFLKLVKPGPVLMIAHNAQFDACFLRELLRGFKPGHLDWLDSLTVYKDRRPYPHKLANAILAYELEDKVQNSHRAIDDVLALLEVLKAMDEERDDLGSYVNLFGYNPKYGVSGRRITGVRYEPQGFNKSITRPEQTLPARMSRRGRTWPRPSPSPARSYASASRTTSAAGSQTACGNAPSHTHAGSSTSAGNVTRRSTTTTTSTSSC